MAFRLIIPRVGPVVPRIDDLNALRSTMYRYMSYLGRSTRESITLTKRSSTPYSCELYTSARFNGDVQELPAISKNDVLDVSS